MYDVYKIKDDFPLLNMQINKKPFVYLDSAASAQKPQSVLNKMHEVYTSLYANPHRGAYYLAEKITQEYENARKTVCEFINAESVKEIIFTRNATESINLVASTWGRQNIKENDEILISEAEHHANLVPWQQLCLQTGAKLKIFSLSENGDFIYENFESALNEKTKLVAVTAMSNVLGTIFPIDKIVNKVHEIGGKVLIDACQGVVHQVIDVRKIDCDFLAFSGHKTYGPSGIGVLYGKKEILEQMPPYQFGGDMVDNVTFECTTFADIPAKFEAGTPASVQAIGMAQGLKYMQKLGIDNIILHEKDVSLYMKERLLEINGLKIVGNALQKGGVFSFALDNIHPQDLSFVLNKENVYVRIGHHCAQPIVNRMGYNSLTRASIGLYTTKEDIDAFMKALIKAKKFFKGN